MSFVQPRTLAGETARRAAMRLIDIPSSRRSRRASACSIGFRTATNRCSRCARWATRPAGAECPTASCLDSGLRPRGLMVKDAGLSRLKFEFDPRRGYRSTVARRTGSVPGERNEAPRLAGHWIAVDPVDDAHRRPRRHAKPGGGKRVLDEDAASPTSSSSSSATTVDLDPVRRLADPVLAHRRRRTSGLRIACGCTSTSP